MTKTSTEKLLFVVNPKSGNNPNVNFEVEISQFADKEKLEYKIYKTKGENDSRHIQKLMSEYQPGKVIAVGGDGTFNLVGSEIIGKKVIFGIIPTGSANGLAFNLNIPTRISEALKTVINGQAIPMDVIKINDEYYCFHLSDIGINARIVKRFEKENTRGMLGYGKQLFKELFSPKSFFSFSIKTENSNKRSKAEMIVIANAQSYGTGMKINSNGIINDGKFEIVVIKPYPWWFIFKFIFAGFSGHLHRMEYISVFNANEAQIKLDKHQDFQIDGEIIGQIENLKIEIIPHAITVIQGMEHN